jgi:hypothetical protein
MSRTGKRSSGATSMSDWSQSNNGSIPSTFLCVTGVSEGDWYCSHRSHPTELRGNYCLPGVGPFLYQGFIMNISDDCKPFDVIPRN